jgi:hypothetical protein
MLGHGMLMVVGGGGALASVVFDSAAKVSGYSLRSGSPSVSFDATNIGMSISGGNAINFVAYDSFGSFARPVKFTAKVKFVSNSAGINHFGMFSDSGSSGVNGYRTAFYSSSVLISKFVGGSETVILNKNASIVVSVGQTYDISAEFKTDGIINYSLNGTVIGTASDSSYSSIRPGFFVYGSAILVKSLTVSAS